MNIFVSSPVLAILALVGVIGGSLVAVPELDLPLPKSEPVSFVQSVEAKCPDQRLKSKFQYNASCVVQALMEYTDISD